MIYDEIIGVCFILDCYKVPFCKIRFFKAP